VISTKDGRSRGSNEELPEVQKQDRISARVAAGKRELFLENPTTKVSRAQGPSMQFKAFLFCFIFLT
jgi:hypothetical protein